MNIGVYSPNWVGDSVMALKFIGRLRKQYADDKLIVIARDWVAAIFDNHPLINKVLPVPTKELAGLFNTIKTGRSLQKLNLDIFFVKTHEIPFYFPLRLAHSNSFFDNLAPLGQAAFILPALRRSSC